jgi:hypothetical protein
MSIFDLLYTSKAVQSGLEKSFRAERTSAISKYLRPIISQFVDAIDDIISTRPTPYTFERARADLLHCIDGQLRDLKPQL